MIIRNYSIPGRISIVSTIILCVAQIAACATNANQYSAVDCAAPDKELVDYTIGPGDTLQIVVWRNEELTATIPVRPDGRISTPLVDDMRASGKTPSELGADMEVVLAEYLRTPEVSVIVIDQGAANQVQVVGEVATPQSLAYREGLRVLDVIVAVGGLSDFAAGNRSNLVRQSSTGQIECNIRIKSLMSGDMSQNIKIYPGDVLVIPESRF